VSLDALQCEVLAVVCSLPEARGFALAGGGAMLAHGLVERPTQDLDLFTPVAVDVEPAAEALRVALSALGYRVEVVRQVPTFVRLTVARPNGASTTVELAQDWRRHEPVMLSVGRVLAKEDVAASKTLALFDRAAARDLVDVDALTGQLGRDGLLRLAADSDAGFAELGVSGNALAELRGHAKDWSRALRAEPAS
jgi:hypothetical protein